MNTFKVTLEDNDYFITGFNGTLKDAKNYYLNKYFNFGIDTDIMKKCIKNKEVL